MSVVSKYFGTFNIKKSFSKNTGDDLYPEEVDIAGDHPPPVVRGTIQDNLHSSHYHHRFEMRDVYDVVLHTSVKQKQGHCEPMRYTDIASKYPLV